MNDVLSRGWQVNDPSDVVETREGITESEAPQVKTFGQFTVMNVAVTANVPLVVYHDVVTQYVSIASSGGNFNFCLGGSFDANFQMPVFANQVVRVPTQGYRHVTLKAGSSVNVTVVWHDDKNTII